MLRCSYFPGWDLRNLHYALVGCNVSQQGPMRPSHHLRLSSNLSIKKLRVIECPHPASQIDVERQRHALQSQLRTPTSADVAAPISGGGGDGGGGQRVQRRRHRQLQRRDRQRNRRRRQASTAPGRDLLGGAGGDGGVRGRAIPIT